MIFMAHIHSTQQSVYSKGFSLLELLLVLFIMGLMTATTMLMTGGVEDQSKYDETKRRMELIKRAIVGDPTRTVNGGPEISGFVADMGRLPGCIAELLMPGADKAAGPPKIYNSPCDGTTEIAEWHMDVTTGLWLGWRGPYLDVMPESTLDASTNSYLAFRDGYGTAGNAAADYGWLFGTHSAVDGTACASAGAAQTTSGVIALQSCGQDGVTGGAANTPDADYPAAGNLVSQNDYQAHLLNWDDITVQINNKSAAAATIAANALRLKLSYPEAGSVNYWPATAALRDAEDYLSNTFPASTLVIPSASAVGSVAVAANDTATVPAGSNLAGNSLTFANAGNVTFASVAVAVLVSDTVTVPAGSNLAGNTLTIANAGNVFFPAGKTFSITTGLNGTASMTVNMGGYSLIVACEDITNPASVSGKRYDGDCTRYGTDAAPIDYEPVNTPYLFKLAPRAQPVSPPSPLIWDIK
jgi:prepilin-type N-terminal cleavage/methylation domain-containing protein